MRPRDILAENLKKLMAATPSLRTIPELTKASSVSNGTLDRIRRADVATNVDVLEQLARAFGVTPWQLLVQDLVVTTGKDGMPQVAGIPEWPFSAIPQSRFLALTPDDRGYVQRRLIQAIAECEPPEPASAPLPRVQPTAQPARTTLSDKLDNMDEESDSNRHKRRRS
jgi:hypothetical protein